MKQETTQPIQLIVGLGNPGSEYKHTRHNAGAWFIERLAKNYGGTFIVEKKFFGLLATITIDTAKLRLLFPTLFMNRSGKAVQAAMNFYQFPIESLLVIHDELDLPLGVARLKKGGGHGGHNGLQDIFSSLGNNRDFLRLRLGIGRPNTNTPIDGYVLSKPSVSETKIITASIDNATALISNIIKPKLREQAIAQLHTRQA